MQQLSDEWRAARVGKITASVAAGALGLNPNMSRQEAWRRCLGRQKETTNRFVEWGRNMEAHARSEYECITGRLVDQVGLIVCADHPWLAASPDGLIDSDGLLEVKAPSDLPTKVSTCHRIQMLVQMICTGRSWCDYFAWTPNGYYLERVHLQGAAGLIRKLRAFYDEFVVTDVEPPRKKPKRRKKPLTPVPLAT